MKSLRLRTDELVNLINECSDEETKASEEYKAATSMLDEAMVLINKKDNEMIVD